MSLRKLDLSDTGWSGTVPTELCVEPLSHGLRRSENVLTHLSVLLRIRGRLGNLSTLLMDNLSLIGTIPTEL
jgi:hypothetical protein